MAAKITQLTEAQLQELVKNLAGAGKLVQAGWVACAMMYIDRSTPSKVEEKVRNAYFAGAEHVFKSIIAMLDPGDEITEADLNRMTLLHNEIEEWATLIRAEQRGKAN